MLVSTLLDSSAVALGEGGGKAICRNNFFPSGPINRSEVFCLRRGERVGGGGGWYT